MKLIACDALMGLPRLPLQGLHPDKADLLAEMKRLDIQASVVRHQLALDAGPVAGNRAMLEALTPGDALIGAWFVTPDGVEPDFDPAAMLERMVSAGILVAWTDPQAELFSLLPWCSGPLYQELQLRQIPLLIDYPTLNLDHLDSVLSEFPQLRIILLNVSRLGRSRLLYPLLRRHPNLMLCLNPYYCIHKGIESLCTTFGSQRWVFGAGYPLAEGGAAITGLMYADITEPQRCDIAYRNMERLLSEVKK
jgi:hypothetical protein